MKKKTFDYKWIIAILCFLMIFTCLGFCSSNSSLYLNAITEALDFSRSSYSLTNTLRFVSTAFINLFFGKLIARFGAKKMVCAGFICLISAVLLYSVAESLLVFYLGGILLGLGFAWTGTTIIGSVVAKWFPENRGTVMGFVLAANGLGGALAAQIVSPLIYDESTAFGYRNAYRLVALILAVVGLLVVLLFKNQPKAYIDDGKPVAKKRRGQSWVGIEYTAITKMPLFYAALVCIFLTGFILQGFNGVAAAHLKDVQLDAAFVATVMSVHSIALAAFKFLTGFLYDKRGLRVTMTVCSVAALVSLTMLSLVTNSVYGRFMAMAYGIISSLALPLETIMLPIYAGDLFGDKAYNKVLGLFVSVNVAGYALGTPIINLVFDLVGSYIPAFVFFAAAMLAVMIAMTFIIRAAHKLRNAQEEALPVSA